MPTGFSQIRGAPVSGWLGNQETNGARMKRYKGWAFLLLIAASGCASQIQSSPNAGLRFPADAAAITAVFDTTTAGWNRGELPVYLSAYTESATAMGRNGPERGVNAI